MPPPPPSPPPSCHILPTSRSSSLSCPCSSLPSTCLLQLTSASPWFSQQSSEPASSRMRKEDGRKLKENHEGGGRNFKVEVSPEIEDLRSLRCE
eukprot:768708-Hanusia_phi.AAC.3